MNDVINLDRQVVAETNARNFLELDRVAECKLRRLPWLRPTELMAVIRNYNDLWYHSVIELRVGIIWLREVQ